MRFVRVPVAAGDQWAYRRMDEKKEERKEERKDEQNEESTPF